MGSRLKEMPSYEQPRERMMHHGTAALTDTELLAIMLRTGTGEKTAIGLAGEVLSKMGGIRGLTQTGLGELQSIKGVGSSKACQIMASFEIAKRINGQAPHLYYTIKNPSDVFDFVIGDLKFENREVFMILGLSSKKQVIGKHVVSIGTINKTIVHPREVFSWAIKNKCVGIIAVHNHPSGNVTPSEQDITLTQRIAEAGDIIGIELFDHIIVGYEDYYSLKANGQF